MIMAEVTINQIFTMTRETRTSGHVLLLIFLSGSIDKSVAVERTRMCMSLPNNEIPHLLLACQRNKCFVSMWR